MSKFMSVGVSLVLSLALSNCGSKDSNDSGDGLTGKRGVVQGVVINALTGERIAIPASNGAQGINVLVNHTYKAASAKSEGYDKTDADLLRGEYFISGVPVNQRYPIVVNIPGYQTFDSDVVVEDKTAKESAKNKSTEDLDENAIPTRIANIALYPNDKFGKPLEFQLRKGSERVENATIVIKPASVPATSSVKVSSFESAKDFLQPSIVRTPTLSAVSSDDGEVTFKKGLVLGQTYDWVVYTSRANMTEKKGSFTYGQSNFVGGGSPGLGLAEDSSRFVVRVEMQ